MHLHSSVEEALISPFAIPRNYAKIGLYEDGGQDSHPNSLLHSPRPICQPRRIETVPEIQKSE
jgi:hypothetical protein